MGFSDIPPPTSTCLKRCRSEDPSSLAELCPPLPKHPPFSSCNSPAQHLSILYDLESSLNAAPAPDFDPPTPEELVKEMMHSLEKVIGDIGELITDPHVCAIADSNGNSVDNSPQESHLRTLGDLVAICNDTNETLDCSSGTLNLCRDAAGNCELPSDVCPNTMMWANLSYSLDEYGRDVASNCDVASACEANGVVNRGDDECSRNGLHSIQHLLDISDGELGLASSVAPKLDNTEQWNLLDDFAHDIATSTMPSNIMLDWLEEGCDILAFSLSHTEDDGLMSRDNSELLTLDC